jgi:tetratricopeptide (TPR) repeat protein
MFIGVYSSLGSGSKEGRGSGKRKRYWFAWDCGDAGYQVQELDRAFQPLSEAAPIDPSTFCASFAQEPSILATPILKGPVAAAQRQAQAGVPLAKTPEQLAAERTEVENHLRAHFGALLLKTRRGGDSQSALKALLDIADVEEGIVPEHKYMFAEFGINLRKGKLPEAALAHAKRVLSLAPDDSHAHFNIARIYYTLGKLDEAEQHLLTALEFAPDLECARDFLAYIGRERRQKELDSPRMQRR